MIAVSIAPPVETARAMEILLAEDPERWCAIKGIVSQLELPTRPLIEIEVGDGWKPVEYLAVYPSGVTFYSGSNGTTVQWPIRRDEAFPRWRPAPRSRLTMALGHHR